MVDVTGSLASLVFAGGLVQHSHPQVQSQAGFFLETIEGADLSGQLSAADHPKAWKGGESLCHLRLWSDLGDLFLQLVDLIQEFSNASCVCQNHFTHPLDFVREPSSSLPALDNLGVMRTDAFEFQHTGKAHSSQLLQILARS